MANYAMFAKINGKNRRVSLGAYPIAAARRIFQSGLLAGSFAGIEMNLKPIKEGKPEYDQTANNEYWRIINNS